MNRPETESRQRRLSLFHSLPKPAVFAHRGASAYAPENTLAAFKLAVKQQADAIEMDAKLTFDGAVILMHDQTLRRTTGKDGEVKKTSLRDIKDLEVGSHFDASFKGEQIPTLQEVFEALGDSTRYNIELTNYTSLFDDLPAKVAAIVEQYKMNERVFFSSFNPVALVRIRKLLPEAPIALLARPGQKGALARSWVGYLFRYDALHIAIEDCNPSIVQRIHSRDRRLHCFTANQTDQVQRMVKLGVDGLFSDNPLLAREAIQSLA